MRVPRPDPIKLTVGIGASAGGLAALKSLVRALPSRAGISYVVIQHLDPSHPSMLSELLDRHSSLPVLEATDGQAIEADTIYVIPPDRHLVIDGGMIRLSQPEERHGLRRTIDHFFSALAASHGPDCAAIVLSGSGSDGTAGLAAVRAAGGLTLAQDPAGAEHPGMPTSAIDAAVTDAVVPVELMAPLLQRFAGSGERPDGVPASEVVGESLASMAQILKVHEEFDLEQYKPSTVQRRIARRMSVTGIASYDDYLEQLRVSPEERAALTKDLLINVTDFFREPDSFRLLEEEIVPAILQTAGSRDVRVWVPGCATGEEAFSIAIVFLEAMASGGEATGLRIFATDIDESAIVKARRAAYPEGIASKVPEHVLDRYFIRDGSLYRVAPAVRDLVSFAVQDIVSDPPFNHMDLISCRNVLIYLRKEVQEKVLKSFYFALQRDGVLLLGSSETVGSLGDLYANLSRRTRAYRKVPGKDARGEVLSSISSSRIRTVLKGMPRPQRPSRNPRRQLEDVEKSLVDAFLPPGVVVDTDGNILYNHGDWKSFMAIPAGEPRNEISRLVLPALRSRVRNAMYKLQKSGSPVTFICFLPVEGSERRRQVQVDLAPLSGIGAEGTRAIGILFRDLGTSDDNRPSGPNRDDMRSANQSLEQELNETREELQNTIEELETSTEELKASNEEALSANEELQSANEELEASAEELRSLNDELTTVNAQLKEKIEQLQAEHNDVENFFSSTNIPTLFLNPDLQIGRYTPAAEQLLKLTPHDIGRDVESLGGQSIGAGLAADARKVLDTLQPVRTEMCSAADRWYIRQVTPYRTQDRRINGVVVVFQDVTHLKELSRRAESREQQQSVVAQLGMLSLAGVGAEELIEQAVNRVADVLQVDLCKVLRYRPETNDLLVVAGKGLKPGIVGQAAVAADKRSQAGFTLMSRQPVIVERLDEERRFSGANLLVDHRATSGMSCLIRHSDPPYGVLAVHTREYRQFTQDDVNFIVSIANLLSTTLRAQESADRLRESELQFRTMANSIPQLAWITDSSGYIIWYNQQWFDFTGTNFEQMKGWGWREVHHPDHVQRVEKKFRNFIASGNQWEDTFPLRSRTGEYRWFLSRAQPIRNESGEVIRWFGTNTDVTQQREQEKALRSSEEKLRLAIETNEIGTFEYYPNEDQVKWDALLDRVWGTGQREKATMTVFWEGLHPDDVAPVRNALEAAVDPDGNGYYRATYRVVNRQTGAVSWIEASGQTLFEDGQATRMVGMVIDITERKELEESLTRAIAELREADTRKNEFLAVLGHELRNPLAALNNSVDMLSLMPTSIDDVIGIMRNSVRTMGRLLDDLLDLNRISQDKIQLDLRVVDVGASLAKALHYATGECGKRQQKLESNVARDLYVQGDATRLEQVFTNLLTNACKYTHHGGHVSVEAWRDGTGVVIEVRDSGIGIESADLQRIFDPFYQVRTENHVNSGLGIGLALSRKLVELHGGMIKATSQGRDRGATLTVRLPAAGSAPADDVEHSGSWPALETGLSVVLIEDNEDILKTLPGLLESLKCRVQTARTAEYGLALARSTRPDAVLIDIGLPDMSGHDVGKALRADGYGGLLVAISGYGHREARERSSEVGFDHHLAKPAKLSEIAGVLAGVRGSQSNGRQPPVT